MSMVTTEMRKSTMMRWEGMSKSIERKINKRKLNRKRNSIMSQNKLKSSMSSTNQKIKIFKRHLPLIEKCSMFLNMKSQSNINQWQHSHKNSDQNQNIKNHNSNISQVISQNTKKRKNLTRPHSNMIILEQVFKSLMQMITMTILMFMAMRNIV